MKLRLSEEVTPRRRAGIVATCFLLIAAIAVLDRILVQQVSLGILYIVPLVVSAVFLPRWAVIILAFVCVFFWEQFGPSSWSNISPERIAMGLIAFPGASLMVAELVRRQRSEAASLQQLRKETALRQEAEAEARALIESSPAAILTVNADGSIDMANVAAKRLLGFESEPMAGEDISHFFPMLGEMLRKKRAVSLVHTMVEGSGRRRNGDMFFAQIWISSYRTTSEPKLAAVVADASEQLRDREELGLRQLLMSSRIVAGAVSHEIRNLAAAASVLHENVGKSATVADTDDFLALGRLIDAMRKLASSETTASAEEVLTGVDLNALLRELNIILKGSDSESEVELRWEVADALPRVRADHSGLLQVFLNLARNSRRALDGRPDGYIAVTAYQLGNSVVMRFADNGPGVASPEGLFQPFLAGAASAGLGLYVSRALIRTYGGELQYMRRASESCFVIELPALATLEPAHG